MSTVDPSIAKSAVAASSRAENVGRVLGWVGFSLSTLSLLLAPLMPNFSPIAALPALSFGLSIAGAFLWREKIISILGIAFAPLAIIFAVLCAIASI